MTASKHQFGYLGATGVCYGWRISWRALRLLGWLGLVLCLTPGILTAQTIPQGLRLPPSLNFATSPNPVGSGARAIGWGTAFIAVADDATAASHNPGGLVQLERPEASIVGSYLLNLERQDQTRSDRVVDDQDLSLIELNYLSVVYPFRLWRRNITVSLNFQRLYNLSGDSDVVSLLNPDECDCIGNQRVRSRQSGQFFSISPAFAVQVTPAFSVGLAVNFWPDWFGYNGWDQDVEVRSGGNIVSGNRVVPYTSRGRIREDYRFRGVNVTAGFFWTINSVFTVGGVFRSPFTAKVKRAHDSEITFDLQDGSEPVETVASFDETLDLDIPMSYGLGVAALISDSLTVSLDVSRIHWSDLRLEKTGEEGRTGTINVDSTTTSGKGEALLEGGGDDVTSVRLGAEYQWILPRLVAPFRAGVFYDPEPGDGGTDDFFGFSVGGGLLIGKFVFDMAYTFRTGEVKSESTETTVYQHTIVTSVIYHF